MHVVIDIGNSSSKLSVFSEDQEIHSVLLEKIYPTDIEKIYGAYPISKSILSSVQKPDDALTTFLKEHTQQFIAFDHKTPVPVKNLYQTPETLGKDRIAAVVGASNIYPGQNVLIFDAGTALTIDFVNKHGEYPGGNISPGMNIRFRALNTFTANLPLHGPAKNFNGLGKNTKEAIVNGVMQGMLNEMENYINQYEQQYKNLKVILTGGDACYFDNKLKKTIFVVQNLVAVGLNRIIRYNATHH